MRKRYLILLSTVVTVLSSFILFIIPYKGVFNTSSFPKLFHYPPQIFSTPTESPSQLRPLPQIKLPIILYHYVEHVKDKRDIYRQKMAIRPEVFESQIRGLKKNFYTSYFVRDIPEILAGRTSLAPKSVVLTFDDGYEDFYTVVFPLLKRYKMKATVYIVYNFVGEKGFVNEKQIRELIESELVEIGSHTLDHTELKKVSEAAQKQIAESKKLLEKKFNINVKTFAYPYGFFSSSLVKLVEETPYTAAVSILNGQTQSYKNLFYLSRVRPEKLNESNIDELLQRVGE